VNKIFSANSPTYVPPVTNIPDPNKIGTLGQAWHTLLSLGIKNERIELFGFEWELQTLQEWEWRLIHLRYNQFDLITKTFSLKVDVLTQAILSTRNITTGEHEEFQTPESKEDLRNHLLMLSPLIIQDLYEIYEALESASRDAFRKEYPTIKEKLAQGFFGFSGLPSTPVNSQT